MATLGSRESAIDGPRRSLRKLRRTLRVIAGVWPDTIYCGVDLVRGLLSMSGLVNAAERRCGNRIMTQAPVEPD